MRIYTIKYKKDLDLPAKEPSSVNDFTTGPFVRKANEYEPMLFKSAEEAKKQAKNISNEKGFDSSSYEVVSMYLDERDALFYLYNLAFGIFPDFRKCMRETPKDLL